MENGHAEERLAERVGLNDSLRFSDNESNHENLSLVIKAVEAAETTIKHQVEENSRLKDELERTVLELAKYKSDESLPQTSNLGVHSNTTTVSHLVHKPFDWKQRVIKASDGVSAGIMVVDPRLNANEEEATVSNRFESNAEGNIVNSIRRGTVDGAGPSQFDSSSTRSSSPMRMRMEGEHAAHTQLSTHGSKPVGEVNHSDNAWKQDLIHKIQQNEQEILHLRKYLTECSIKGTKKRGNP